MERISRPGSHWPLQALGWTDALQEDPPLLTADHRLRRVRQPGLRGRLGAALRRRCAGPLLGQLPAHRAALDGALAALAGDVPDLPPGIPGQAEPAGARPAGGIRRRGLDQAADVRPGILELSANDVLRRHLFVPGRHDAAPRLRRPGRVLHPSRTALCHADRIQAHNAGRLRPRAVRAVQQDRFPR